MIITQALKTVIKNDITHSSFLSKHDLLLSSRNTYGLPRCKNYYDFKK